jgi:ophiobolin F synthase
MSPEMKKLVLMRLEEAGSLEYTKGVLDRLHEELKQELSAVEERAGGENWILRLMLHHLKV